MLYSLSLFLKRERERERVNFRKISFTALLTLSLTILLNFSANANWMEKGWHFQKVKPTNIGRLLILDESKIPNIPTDVIAKTERIVFDYDVDLMPPFAENLKTAFPKLKSIYLNVNTTIPANAFANLDWLTEIAGYKVITIGTGAFNFCSALENASFPKIKDLTTYCDAFIGTPVESEEDCIPFLMANNTLYLNKSFVLEDDLSGISAANLSGITLSDVKTLKINHSSLIEAQLNALKSLTTTLANLEAIEIKNFAGAIPNGCFWIDGTPNTWLKSFKAEKATTIEGGAFNGCTSLETINFPKATSIGQTAFYGCTSLTTIDFPKATDIGHYAFNDCTSLINISNAFPLVQMIGADAFKGCTSLTNIDFPKATMIGNSAFWDCTSLTDISNAFPLLQTIGNYAFYGCTSLTDISFPKATDIGQYAFSGCTSLTTISNDAFPLVQTIRGFAGCTSLTTIDFPKVTTIEEFAFAGCTSLEDISFPKATTIGEAAFQECSNLTTIDFPLATTIEKYAFWGCTGLETVKFGSEIISLGEDVFTTGDTPPYASYTSGVVVLHLNATEKAKVTNGNEWGIINAASATPDAKYEWLRIEDY